MSQAERSIPNRLPVPRRASRDFAVAHRGAIGQLRIVTHLGSVRARGRRERPPIARGDGRHLAVAHFALAEHPLLADGRPRVRSARRCGVQPAVIGPGEGAVG
eukprot:scaffold90683_cov84-Phaeocystis_antarctica.AAC.1